MVDSSKLSRRELLKLGLSAGAAASILGRGVVSAEEEALLPKVPRKVLGKTGKSIPILLMGGAMPLDPKFDPKLAECLRFGVNYFDAADCYGGGTCETYVGNFLARGTDRKKVWITSKSDKHDPKGFEETCNAGLQRMQSDYFDLYFLHALQEGKYLSRELEKTVARLKDEGKIHHFGFSCHHGNVAELLHLAAKTPWVDAVMFRYNFRQYGNKELSEAMDACVKANVGLIAMKTQGSEASFADRWKPYEKMKWSKHQAVLKAVWADERITAAVSHMDNFDKLKQNIAAALDDQELGQADYDVLNRYAADTRSLACDGCDHICGAAVDADVRIGDTLRYLMYHDTYGEQEKARALFAALPKSSRRLSGVDWHGANAACPYGVDVAKHMRRAAEVFSA